jgi:hypothetical protein
MFSVADRQRLNDYVLTMAASDARVVAGAIVGSLAHAGGDRWSDLDLTFGVADGVPIRGMLDEWTGRLAGDFDAICLFDLPSGAAIYRVFLLPGCLQFDLSFAPASAFGALGPNFRLLFGNAVETPHVPPPPAPELFGYAVHHAVRARVCIERGLFWQAEYWTSALRDHALSLACRRRGLPARYGKGVDALPDSVRDRFSGAFVRSLNREELLRALAVSIDGLLGESEEVREVARTVEPRLRELMAR